MVTSDETGNRRGRLTITSGPVARLARSAQVIVVTHLPQVAAFADTHLAVEKSGDGLVTASGVLRLDGPDRVPFRCIPAELWSIENNLNIANMDWEEFAEAVGADGIFRGFRD